MRHVLYVLASSAVDPVALAPACASDLRFAVERSTERAALRLRHGGFDALVLDARGGGGSPIARLLEDLFGGPATPSRVARERTWLLVDGDGSGDVDLAFLAGRARLREILPGSVAAERLGPALRRATVPARRGRVALCLAGGGTEGLFFELGVLRALERFLPERGLADVDILCGISAGAILAAFLACGVGPEELADGLQGRASRVRPIRRAELFDPAVGALARRAGALGREVLLGRRSLLSALFRLPPAGAFAGDRLRAWLARELGRPGMCDSFRELPRTLYVGATDQDTNEHVVFGRPGFDHVPIHRAVRASAALAPFYAPEVVDGRWYVDGGFSRTTNMRVAVEEGATLCILVDPLVPTTSARPGFVAERGGLFAAMQGLKALVNARFDKAMPALRTMYPHVAFHLFQPGEGTRRLMGGSPMKYFYREAIAELAYRETVRELRAHRPEIGRDFERHGMRWLDPQATAPGATRRGAPAPLRLVV